MSETSWRQMSQFWGYSVPSCSYRGTIYFFTQVPLAFPLGSCPDFSTEQIKKEILIHCGCYNSCDTEGRHILQGAMVPLVKRRDVQQIWLWTAIRAVKAVSKVLRSRLLSEQHRWGRVLSENAQNCLPAGNTAWLLRKAAGQSEKGIELWAQ